jgi:hypothetical protein
MLVRMQRLIPAEIPLMRQTETNSTQHAAKVIALTDKLIALTDEEYDTTEETKRFPFFEALVVAIPPSLLIYELVFKLFF